MFCLYCGTRLPEDASFCHSCGKKMPQIDQPATERSQGTSDLKGDTPSAPIVLPEQGNPPSQPGLPAPPDQEWTPTVLSMNPPSQPGFFPPATPGLPPTVAVNPPSQPGLPAPSAPGWPPTVAANPPSQPGWTPTVAANPPSQPGWTPTVAANPPSQPGFPASPPPGWPPTMQQQTGPQAWMQAAQASQPGMNTPSGWLGMPAPSGPISAGGLSPSGPISSGYPSQPGLQNPVSAYPPWLTAPGMPVQAPPPVTQPPPPPDRFQQFLLRRFQRSLAGNAFFGVALGAVVAIVLGALSSLILVAVLHGLAPGYAATSTNGPYHPSGQDALSYALGSIPLHSPWRDGMLLFFVMHGAGIHLSYIFVNSGSWTYDYNAVLNGLLIVPAFALTLGGYVAASTDLYNRAKGSLLRGACIAIPYALLLIVMVPMANGSLPFYPGESSTDVNTIAVDSASLLLNGLLWGAVFGLLGASLKLGRGQWRKMMVTFFATVAQSRIVGMAIGALTAAGVGIALSLLTIFSIMAYTSLSIPLYVSSLCSTYGLADWQLLGGWAVAQGPLHAVNLFFYSFNAPLTINNPKELFAPCFYTPRPQLTLSMFGGDPHLPAWTFALLLIPIVSMFLGGRASALFGKAQDSVQGLVQGALMAIPFTFLMMLLSVYTMLSYQTTGPLGPSRGVVSYTQNFGVGAFDLFLWAFLSSAVLGGLGGAYQASRLKLSVRQSTQGLMMPLYWLGASGARLIEPLRGRPRHAPRTISQTLLYAAIFSALLLIIAVVVFAIAFIAFNQSLPYITNIRIRDIVSVILVALPGLLLLSAGVAALIEEKPTIVPPQPVMPPLPGAGMPFPSSPYPYTNYPGGL